MIEAVVFDIGGVLVTEVPQDYLPRWEASLGMRRGSLLECLLPIWSAGSVGAIDLATVHDRVGAVLGDPSVVPAFMEDVWEVYLGQPVQPLIDYFVGLQSRTRTAMLSNSFVGAREREAERYGFDAMCEHIVYSHEVGVQKPDLRIYERMCDWLELEPTRVLFADDRADNIAAAEAFGMTGVLVDCTTPEAVIGAVERALVR